MIAGPQLAEMARAFATSPSFWQQTVPLAASALLILIALSGFLTVRVRQSARFNRGARGASDLLRGEHGSAQAMDFVLTFPIALLVVYLFLQFLMAAQASLVVHYAAYSAARAARTMYWDMSVDEVRAEQFRERTGANVDFVRANYWRELRRRNEPRARTRANVAARVALMAAVPSSQRTSAPVSADAAVVLKEIASLHRLTVAARNKAAYAFVSSNVRVQVRVAPRYENAQQMFNPGPIQVRALPIEASVVFRFPLRMPVGRFFGTRTPAGGYYRELSAQVTLI